MRIFLPLLFCILSKESSASDSKALKAANKLHNAYTSLKTEQEYKKLVNSPLIWVDSITVDNNDDLKVLLFEKSTPAFRATNVSSAVFSDGKNTLTYRVSKGKATSEEVEIKAKKVDGKWMFVLENNYRSC